MRNVKMSPCSPHPKQCHVSRSGETMKDGVFSAWKGQRPLETVPARFSETVSPTMSATGSFDLISATMPEELVIWLTLARAIRACQVVCQGFEGNSTTLSSMEPTRTRLGRLAATR